MARGPEREVDERCWVSEHELSTEVFCQLLSFALLWRVDTLTRGLRTTLMMNRRPEDICRAPMHATDTCCRPRVFRNSLIRVRRALKRG